MVLNNTILFVILISIICGGLWYILNKENSDKDQSITPTNTPQSTLTTPTNTPQSTPLTTPTNTPRSTPLTTPTNTPLYDPCIPNPCKNEGTCIVEAGGFFRCVCPTYPSGEPKFIGRDCGFTAD